MIYESLRLIVKELNSFIKSFESSVDDIVVLDNISQLKSTTTGIVGSGRLLEKIVLDPILNMR